MSESWSHTHGLGKRGADYTPQGGATHGGASLALKQIQGRIHELFGKQTDAADKRRRGIPTHFDQLQLLFKNLKAAVGEATARDIENSAAKDIQKALQYANIDIPELGLVMPTIKTVWVFSRSGEKCIFSGEYFESDLAEKYAFWKLSGTVLGDFHSLYSVYKAWPYYQNIAPPTVTDKDGYYVVGNFFADGLQWSG